MSYGNAVPKPLKFLISDGKMIDDAGNVIGESETLKDLYTKWNPEVKKYLLSDGSVVDENNNVIVKNDWWKAFYDMACPKIAKYLHADGTVDENPGSGNADLEDNHQTTIDVSTYTQPVEVLPTSGKDGMKKNTVTLSNIPSGATPSTDYPSWWVEGDEFTSVVPNGIECVACDERNYIIVGDGVSSLGDLLVEFGTVYFSAFYASYGESVVFSFFTDK